MVLLPVDILRFIARQRVRVVRVDIPARRGVLQNKYAMGIRGNPKDVDFFVMQEERRRADGSATVRLLW